MVWTTIGCCIGLLSFGNEFESSKILDKFFIEVQIIRKKYTGMIAGKIRSLEK